MSDAIPAAPEPQPKTPPKPHGGPKEVVEQILIAFILAFIFRWFVCEAFVIPTGSMAPTLLGAHMDFRCPDCGWKFTADYPAKDPSNPNASPPERAVGQHFPIRCPNCAYLFPVGPAGGATTDAAGTGSEPLVSYGDRILVQRFAYLFADPARWDVVVFRSPSDDDLVARQGDQYQQNYIKRLVGKPGESVIVLDGDVYVSTSPKPAEQLGPGDFTVQTKPWSAQSAMWRVVYDDDHRPRGLSRAQTRPNAQGDAAPWTQPWVNAGDVAWDTTGRAFKVDARSGGAAARLRFDFANSMTRKSPLTDWLGYDVTAPVESGQNLAPGLFPYDGRSWPVDKYLQSPQLLSPVSDVMLALSYRRLDGTGPLRLKTTKRGIEFEAVITPEGVELFKTDSAGRTSLAKAQKPNIGAGAGTRIEFVNADYRVYVRIDGREVVTSTPAQYAPNVDALLREYAGKTDGIPPNARPELRIEAEAQQVEVSHVSLWRDVYYTRAETGWKPMKWASPASLASNLLYGSAHNESKGPIRLGAGEYFVLGDNSLLSLDGRFWDNDIDLRKSENLYVESGRVPERFMLGKAFFVYWPAGYRPASGFPPIVPNAGEIRFIH